jgi:hypothetical protein
MILVKIAVMMVNKIYTIKTYTLMEIQLKSGWQGSIILSAIG